MANAAQNLTAQAQPIDLSKLNGPELSRLMCQLMAQAAASAAGTHAEAVKQTKLLEVHGQQLTTLLELSESQAQLLEELVDGESDEEEDPDAPLPYAPVELGARQPVARGVVRNAPARVVERVLDEPVPPPNDGPSPYQPIDPPVSPWVPGPDGEEVLDAANVDPRTHPANVAFRQLCAPIDKG